MKGLVNGVIAYFIITNNDYYKIIINNILSIHYFSSLISI